VPSSRSENIARVDETVDETVDSREEDGVRTGGVASEGDPALSEAASLEGMFVAQEGFKEKVNVVAADVDGAENLNEVVGREEAGRENGCVITEEPKVKEGGEIEGAPASERREGDILLELVSGFMMIFFQLLSCPMRGKWH
jgi:hypothetical protein